MFSVFVATVLTGYGSSVFSVFLTTALTEHKAIIFGALFAIVVLGLSVYVSLRTSFLHNSVAADVNMYSYALQADISSGRKGNVYREIAKEWLKFSDDGRHVAKLHAYSARSCLWSLIFLAITLLLLLSEQLFWIIPFGIAAAFFILSILIQVSSLDAPFLRRLLSRFPFLYPELPRWNEITKVIEKHEWLKN